MKNFTNFTKLSKSTTEDVSQMLDGLKGNIYRVLVNFQRNKSLLKQVPHTQFLSTTAIFTIQGRRETSTEMELIIISNKLLKAWGITLEELEQIAAANEANAYTCEELKEEVILPKPYGYVKDEDDEEDDDDCDCCDDCDCDDEDDYIVKDDSDVIPADTNYLIFDYVLNSGMDVSDDVKVDFDITLYKVTNKYAKFGTAAVLNNDYLKAFCEEKGVEEVFVVLSSVNEVILAPIQDAGLAFGMRKELDEALQNENYGSDLLTNYVMIYNADRNETVIM